MGQLDKYSDQVSKTAVKLERGEKYYIEILHTADQGKSDDFNFNVISADHFSTYSKASAVLRKEAIPTVLSRRFQNSSQIKSANGTKHDYYKFYSLPVYSYREISTLV